ncbi:Gfo/Idh/MocA family oxidoreductase [Paenibacillus rhizovicinus]|uniref:Gfo/Idh/MocA family oxidoreductase n=1 Tax=Paenibacillus rhizovicinus TaxID=2704463 RepID=A0A6C0P5D6_9BACL|nr:Gfo/Idh/MocA family oxidoreductase [Paenibacillus rhizovicinus]QHW33697.1 Gfo/Idh/MocA family oxidoreductase [Paenibacillus rhizovicinus]
MKVAVISFAHMHAYSYAEHLTASPDAELSAVWDEDETRGMEAASRYGVPYYRELDELLRTDAAAVIVCSENARHKEHVIAAAAAGKHVLCEKPIAVDPDDAEAMIRACRDNGVILQIAFPVRYSPVIRQARELIRSGQLGSIIGVNATNHGKMPGGWFIDPQLSGGGAAVDHIVHVMDILFWVLEKKVTRVHAELDTRLHDIEVEDCGIVLLEMESGIIAAIDPSWSRPASYPIWGDLVISFTGTKGTLHLDLHKQASVFYNDVKDKTEWMLWTDDLDEGLVGDFLAIVREGRPASISGEDGLATLRVVRSALASHLSGRAIEL